MTPLNLASLKQAHARGVRMVAVFEALKGAVVLVAGFGLMSLVHHDLQAFAEKLVRLSHLNPARHYPQVFIKAMSHLSDQHLVGLSALALVYAVVRFAEAYGLWYAKAWAEWFAIISGGIYLPVEAYELYEHVTWVRVLVLVTNAMIVLFLAYVRLTNRSAEK